MKRYIKSYEIGTVISLGVLQLELNNALEKYADNIGLNKSRTKLSIDEEDDYIDINLELGKELNDKQLNEFCDILDNIIKKYEPDAYFEDVEPTIIGTRIWKPLEYDVYEHVEGLPDSYDSVNRDLTDWCYDEHMSSKEAEKAMQDLMDNGYTDAYGRKTTLYIVEY